MTLSKNIEAIENETSTNIDTSMLETALIARTKLAIPAKTWRLYDKLKRKFQKETITEQELETFREINETMEEANVDRVEALFELAKLRDVSIKVILEQYGNARP
jgi:tRNA C32,U32 (ribose-2'-O)-methylase TrmJ